MRAPGGEHGRARDPARRARWEKRAPRDDAHRNGPRLACPPRYSPRRHRRCGLRRRVERTLLLLLRRSHFHRSLQPACNQPLLSCDGGRRGGSYTRRGCHRCRRIGIARNVLMKLLLHPLICSVLCLMAAPLQFSVLGRVELAGRYLLALPLPKAVI